MLDTVIWALMTGCLTGGVWVAIVLLRRQHRSAGHERESLEDVQRRLDQLGHVNPRLDEVEERLDFAERLLAQQRDAQRLEPPDRPG